MSEIERLFSPDRRFFILLGRDEIRMSHWITSMALWQSSPERPILQLGDSLWSAEQVHWHADSSCLSVELRRYPGDAPTLVVDIYPDQRLVRLPALPGAAALRFEELESYLELYYAQHRGRPSVRGDQDNG
jgi:hypothetical protein